MPEMKYNYTDQESQIFGRVKRPLIELDAYSHARERWIPLFEVLVDTGADMSVLPRIIGELLVEDITLGRRVEIRGVAPNSRLVCYIHDLKFRIAEREFNLPVALAESDDVPSLLGRIRGIDIFDVEFLKGKEVGIRWEDSRGGVGE